MKAFTGTLLLYFISFWCLVHNSPNLQVRMKRAIASSEDKSVQVKIEDSPYLVNVFELDQRTCAGTILSSTVVITLARCISDKPFLQHDYAVHSGLTRMDDGERHEVVKIIKQREGTAALTTGSLALLEVDPPIDLVKSPNRAIPLHPITALAKDTKAKFTGWGCVYQKNPALSHQQLHSENVLIIDRSSCIKDFSGKHVPVVSNTSICTSVSPKHVGKCHGDVGAPLVVKGQLIAVMTWPAMLDNYNASVFVYTNLAEEKNYKWIVKNLRKN